MPDPLTEQDVFILNNDTMPVFTRTRMGDRLNVLGNPSGGADYYVNSNLSATAGDGSSWAKAFKTLTEAMAASHAKIATGLVYWAARNRIFYKGDNNSETLTTLAQKTDIIGVGSGGGHRTMATIQGTHIIGAGAFVGCRFYNMGFVPASATNNIFKAPATCRGLEFHGCRFDGSAPIAGSAIVTTALWFLRIVNCDFVGQFSDAVIEILAGNSQGLYIGHNRMEGGENGIELVTGVTSSPTKMLAEYNTIDTVGICINDVDATLLRTVGNNMVTANAEGSLGAGAIVYNKQISVANRASFSDKINCPIPLQGTID